MLVCLWNILLEFYRGTRARRAGSGETVWQAFVSVIRRNRRRYGGYIVHFGIVLPLCRDYRLCIPDKKNVSLHPGKALLLGLHLTV